MNSFLLLLLPFVISQPLLAQPGPKELRLYFTANRQGEIEPCGCARGRIGGLTRVANLLAQERKKTADRSSLFVDSGDTFFLFSELQATRGEEEVRKARLIAAAYQKLGLNAFSPGERDFAGGLPLLLELRKESGAAFVSANLRGEDGALLFEPFHLFTERGLRVAVTGIASEEAFQKISGIKVSPPKEALSSVLSQIRSQSPDVIVVLSHRGMKADREMAKEPGIDVIVGSHSLDITDKPVREGSTAIVQADLQGQQLGILDWKGGDVQGALVDLDTRYDGKNGLAPLIKQFHEQTRKVALVSDHAGAATGPHAFVANFNTCQQCHEAQTKFWLGTHHASAYLVLYAKNQHFDPECISCHSLGFEAPGGFQKIASPIEMIDAKPRKKGELPLIEKIMDRVFKQDSGKGALDSRVDPKRYAALKARYHAEIDTLQATGKLKRLFAGVQCENCHGNRQGHPSPSVVTQKKVPRSACVTCHQPPRDMEFNFEKGKAKVACPLMVKK